MINELDSASHDLALQILDSANEMSLATLRADGAPHVTTVSFANDDLLIYAAIAIDSHKAHDIGRDRRVAMAVNAPYRHWNEFQGMSIDAEAELVREPAELALAGALLLQKLPAYADIVAETALLPWPGMVFIRMRPHAISLLDYTKGFGHTTVFEFHRRAGAQVGMA
jgi:hypothetical protein